MMMGASETRVAPAALSSIKPWSSSTVANMRVRIFLRRCCDGASGRFRLVPGTRRRHRAEPVEAQTA